MLRTFVSFEADFPTDGHPAGRELADFVANAIRKQGMAVSIQPIERIGRGISDTTPKVCQLKLSSASPTTDRDSGKYTITLPCRSFSD